MNKTTLDNEVKRVLKRFPALKGLQGDAPSQRGSIRMISNIIQNCNDGDVSDYAYSVAYEICYVRELVAKTDLYLLAFQIQHLYNIFKNASFVNERGLQ